MTQEPQAGEWHYAGDDCACRCTNGSHEKEKHANSIFMLNSQAAALKATEAERDQAIDDWGIALGLVLIEQGKSSELERQIETAVKYVRLYAIAADGKAKQKAEDWLRGTRP